MSFTSSGVVFQRIEDDDGGAETHTTRTASATKSRRSSKKASPPPSPSSSTSKKPSSSGGGNKSSPNRLKKTKKPASPKSAPESPNRRTTSIMKDSLKRNTKASSISSEPVQQQQQQQQKPQSGSKPRLSFRRGSLRRGSHKSPKGAAAAAAATMDFDVAGGAAAAPEEDDPVMVLFQARNTQKVRFSLDGAGPPPRERGALPRPDSSHNLHDPQQQQQSSSSLSFPDSPRSSFNIKKFMKGALFGGNSNSNSSSNSSPNNKQQGIKPIPSEEYEFELAKEVEAVKQQNDQMVWTTDDDEPEVLKTKRTNSRLQQQQQQQQQTATENATDEQDEKLSSFQEDRETRATVMKLLNKARRAQFLHYRYNYAVRTYIRALDLMRDAAYPDRHPTVAKTLKLLQNAHFCETSFRNSANIVKLGIKYEDTGELVRALKMYTIAYRIRRDNLSASHPSLVVLLNMLGSIQIKRGELEEAMQIFQLALRDTGGSTAASSSAAAATTATPTPTTPQSPTSAASSDDSTLSPLPPPPSLPQQQSSSSSSSPVLFHYLTRAVTYREMGTIHEQWSEIERAHHMYHASLECMADYKGLVGCFRKPAFVLEYSHAEEKKLPEDGSSSNNEHGLTILHDLEDMRLAGEAVAPYDQEDEGEEVPFLAVSGGGTSKKGGSGKHKGSERGGGNSSSSAPTTVPPSRYDVFFPAHLDEKMNKKSKRNGKRGHSGGGDERRGDHTDVEVALTIHRIAQLHRAQHEYHLALPAFYVSLRGMKYALGKSHPNVAAILGNIGNLLKEMGDMDAAYSTYQQVLAIESYRLGLSHPDVVVTLHNIATIDAARGNLDHALSLYTQVVNLQRKLFGEDDESVAVTSACMGDVYERLGDNKSAVESYEEALRIKIAALGRHALETARLLHKLGKLAVAQGDYHLAESYITKAALVYRLNKLSEVDEWVVDVNRDHADVEAAIAMGRGQVFEC